MGNEKEYRLTIGGEYVGQFNGEEIFMIALFSFFNKPINSINSTNE